MTTFHKSGSQRFISNKGPRCRGPSCSEYQVLSTKYRFLDVVVQAELVRMRAQADGVHFLGALVLDVRAEQFFGEDVALEQELMVLLERGESVVERARHRGDLREFLGAEIVDVLVERLAGIDLVLDKIGRASCRERV